MVATTSSAANSANDNGSARRSWTPDGNDHLIFQWVRMEGKTQSWVATQLGINQATVSRVIQRYERWQAHAREREGGRLDYTERLRAQRWLTFERNELILASCLRIAGEMEGFVDTSKSTIHRPLNKPSQENEVRTEHAMLDRSGVAARFLRLAFRINMEQLKLAELDPPPPALPLTAEEIAQEEHEADAAAEELAMSRYRQGEAFEEGENESRPLPPEGASNGQAAHVAEHFCEPSDTTQETDSTRQSEPGAEPRDEPSPATSLHKVHNLHNADAPESDVSAAELCSCVTPSPAENNSETACIAAKSKRTWQGHRRSSGRKRRARQPR